MEVKRSNLLTKEFVLAINTLLVRAKERNIDMNQTKIQKLLYLWYRACLRDEGSDNPFRSTPNVFSAWNYGPVILEIMYYFKYYSLKPILFDGAVRGYEEKQEHLGGQKMMSHLENVLNDYGDFTASRLTNITHSIGSPYAKTLTIDGPYKKIKDEYITEK